MTTILWALSLTLFIIARNTDITKRLDEVRAYQLQKVPHSFPDALYSIQQSFSMYWVDDTCYSLSTTLNQSSTCLAKRSDLVSHIVAALQCDKYASQVCKCVAKINLGILNPATGNNGKDLSGKRESTLYAIESCRWLMHNANIAVSTGDVVITRTALLFIIATVISCNVGGTLLMTLFMGYEGKTRGLSTFSGFVYLLTVGICFGVVCGLYSTTWIIVIILLAVPSFALFFYEFLSHMKPMTHQPYIHPYCFTVVLGALSLLSLVENGITDYDAIIFEILKSNAIGFMYVQIIWKYMSVKNNESQSSSYEEAGTLRSVLLAIAVYLLGLVAPYTLFPLTNIMWYAPLTWVLFAFGSVAWICTFKFKPHPSTVTDETDKDYVIASHQHVAFLLMAFLFVLYMYYLKEHTLVYRVLIDLFPPNSVQLNATASWTIP